MEVVSDFWLRRLYGSIAVEPLSRPQAGPQEFLREVVSRSRYAWQPPYQITGLPSWFELALDSYARADGTRRFTLVEPSESGPAPVRPGIRHISTARGLSLVASVGGYRLMLDRGEVGRDLLLSHDEARIYLLHVEHRRGYFGRRKRLESALHVCASGRFDKATKSVLPEDLGLCANGLGETWDIARLRDDGRRAALEAGIDNPTPMHVLSHGLLEAAKINPLFVKSPKESAAVTKMALFALPESTERVTKAQLNYVATHVRNSLREHLDDSDEKFDLWLKDPDANLLHRIQKRPDCKMSRPQVKHALVGLGWHALRMIGTCIDVQMRSFLNTLSPTLSEIENFYFSQVFLARTMFGGLPLLLLHDRFDVLSAPIINIWNNPGDPSAIAAAHRVMAYYAELIGNRRMADRTHKQRGIGRNKRGRAPIDVPLIIEPAAVSTEDGILVEPESVSTDEAAVFDRAMPCMSREQDDFRQIAKCLAEVRGFKCDFDGHHWLAALQSSDGNKITFNLCCPDLDFDQMIAVPRREFEVVARSVRELE